MFLSLQSLFSMCLSFISNKVYTLKTMQLLYVHTKMPVYNLRLVILVLYKNL